MASVLGERAGEDERVLADEVWRHCRTALSKSRAHKGGPRPPSHPPPQRILKQHARGLMVR